MKRFILPLLWLLLGHVSFAGIVLDEPVIQMNGSEPQYLKFVGTNSENNYRFTLDTYQDDGLKFRLTLDRINEKSPAYFTLDDLNDENYWEPMFRQYTKQLAGEEMLAQNNIKQIYVNGVALLDNQFAGYCDALKYVEINASGNYEIPDGCFAKGTAKNYSIKQIICNVEGTLTLGNNVVDANAGGLTVSTSKAAVAQVWYDYKTSNNAAFALLLNNEAYEGGYDANAPAITGVNATYTINETASNISIPNMGISVSTTQYGTASSFVLNSFTATTTGNVTEVFMDYAVYPEGHGGEQHSWTQIHATANGDGTWTANSNVNLMAGLASNTTYVFECAFNTNPSDKGDRAHYPTDGSHIRITFTTGEMPSNFVMDEPVIEMNGSDPSYIKFVGTNAANNYRYTLDTYQDDGIKFRLTLDRIDPTKPAAVTLADIVDENYWEPLFSRYTLALAGFEMLAKNNIKKLIVNDVALLPNQFVDYCDAMKEVSINAEGDYNIPNGLFAQIDAENYGIKKLVCFVGGDLTLGDGVVEPTAGGLTVYTYLEDIARTWYDYKKDNSAAFVIYLNDEPYVPSDPAIVSVSTVYTVNGTTKTQAIPNAGEEVKDDAFNGITSFVLNSFTAATTGDVTEVFMDYDIFEDGLDGRQNQWKQMYATANGDGTWTASTPINVLAGLDSNTTYSLEISFNTNPGDYGRAHFPTNGSHIRIHFTTGDLTTGIDAMQTGFVTDKSEIYDLQGRRVNANYKGIVIQGGKKFLK